VKHSNLDTSSFRRELGLVDAAAIVAGGIVGVGIFANPSNVARVVRDPVLILFVYWRGFAGGFDFAGIWRTATGPNTTNTLVAAAVMFAAGLIGALGWVLCCVGLLFTLPYQQAITAGAVTWYERVATGGDAVQFFEMNLVRVGDTSWPAAGTIPPR